MRNEYTLQFTSKGKAQLLSFAPPIEPIPPGEVEGHTLHSLISTGTELAIYQGASFPCEVGYAAVVLVERTGGQASGPQPGDRILALAPHRTWQRVHQQAVVKVPVILPSEHAVFARLMSVSMSTLATTAARPPSLVVVSGLGLVGHFAARIFRLCGYEVIACDPIDTRRKLVEVHGIRTCHSIPVDDPSVAGAAALVLECSGHERAALDACQVVAKRGEVVLVGVPWQRRTDLSAHDLLHAIFHKYAVVRSGWEWEVPFHPTDFIQNSIRSNLEAALKWLAEGKVSVEGLYAMVSPQEAQEAYQALLRGQVIQLGAVFDWKSLE